MACFTCGKSFLYKELDFIKRLKIDYEKNGIERYVYRVSSTSNLMVVQKKHFNDIFQKQIKPNIKNGAEYMHISEFRPS